MLLPRFLLYFSVLYFCHFCLLPCCPDQLQRYLSVLVWLHLALHFVYFQAVKRYEQTHINLFTAAKFNKKF